VAYCRYSVCVFGVTSDRILCYCLMSISVLLMMILLLCDIILYCVNVTEMMTGNGIIQYYSIGSVMAAIVG